MKQHNKLVRDKILEIIKADGVDYQSRTLNDDEYKQELLKKLVEEANEVLETNGNSEELIKELADVSEVIEYIIKTFSVSQNEVDEVKQQRHNKRGGFDEKIFLETTSD